MESYFDDILGGIMRVKIEESERYLETEIHIKCYKVDDSIKNIITCIERKECFILGKQENKICKIQLSEILYFESVEGKTYIYTNEDVFACDEKLYQIEQQVGGMMFIRISKSIVLNIHKLMSIRPLLYGKMEATLENGEKIIISRHYVKGLKEKLDF